MGPIDTTTTTVQRWLIGSGSGSSSCILGDGGERWKPKTVDIQSVRGLVVVRWSVVVSTDDGGSGKFREDWFRVELCRCFSAKVAPYCGGAWSRIVSGDKGDRLEVSAYPMVAPICRKEAVKMAACKLCTAPAGFFLSIFWQLMALPTGDLDLRLLAVLRGVR